jgi:ATP diphosphatase
MALVAQSLARRKNQGRGSTQMKSARNISRLIEIMAALRNKDTGCPWDVEQTFSSIAPYTIEEAYEVADAIERGDIENLREELGDLLLQVVYHARIAEEDGSFEFGDVVEAITEKMIRRHPHVFGDEKARSAGMAKGAWERIKAEEKRIKAEKRRAVGLPENEFPSILSDIPASLPGIIRALKLQQKAATVGFDWDNPKDVLAKLHEEIGEVELAIASGNSSNIEDEIGDAFFTLTNLARHHGIDPEAASRRSNQKFLTRFTFIEKSLAAENKSLNDCSLDEMEQLWQQAKGFDLPK